MWNWFAGAAGVVITGWVLQQFGKGGRRWRSLTIAGHELDVANRLPDDHPLARRLREAAEAKVDRYLREPTPGRRTALREGALAAIGAGYFIVLLLFLNLEWWGYAGLGLVTVLMTLSSWAAFRSSKRQHRADYDPFPDSHHILRRGR